MAVAAPGSFKINLRLFLVGTKRAISREIQPGLFEKPTSGCRLLLRGGTQQPHTDGRAEVRNTFPRPQLLLHHKSWLDFSGFLVWIEDVWDRLGLLIWSYANYLSQDFISLLGGIMTRYVEMPSTEPIYSNLVPPWAPVSGLREIRPAVE